MCLRQLQSFQIWALMFRQAVQSVVFWGHRKWQAVSEIRLLVLPDPLFLHCVCLSGCVCVCARAVPLFAVMAGPPLPANNTRLFLRDEHIRPECHTAQTRMIRGCTPTHTHTHSAAVYNIPSSGYQHTVAVLSLGPIMNTTPTLQRTSPPEKHTMCDVCEDITWSKVRAHNQRCKVEYIKILTRCHHLSTISSPDLCPIKQHKTHNPVII